MKVLPFFLAIALVESSVLPVTTCNTGKLLQYIVPSI